MRISDWSSDVCSSDLKRLPVRADRGDVGGRGAAVGQRPQCGVGEGATDAHVEFGDRVERYPRRVLAELDQLPAQLPLPGIGAAEHQARRRAPVVRLVEFDQRGVDSVGAGAGDQARSDEHTSELQSLMRISYAVLCLKTKK